MAWFYTEIHSVGKQPPGSILGETQSRRPRGGHGVAFIEGCCLGLTDQRGPTGSFKVVDETEEGQSSGWGKHHRALGVLPVSNSHSGILCTGEAGKDPVKACENPPRRMFPTILFVMTRTLELTYAHPKRAWINELGRIHKMEEYRFNQGCRYSCWWQSAIQYWAKEPTKAVMRHETTHAKETENRAREAAQLVKCPQCKCKRPGFKSPEST